MTAVIINPGNGPIERDVTRAHAIANIAAFIEDLGMADPPVKVTKTAARHDGTGRYAFVLRRGKRSVDVDMPGLPLAEVRFAENSRIPHGCPRLYVDGNSWWWPYALGITTRALADHDGSIEAHIKASEAAADAELEARPRCEVCGGVRSARLDKEDLHRVECLTCVPRYHITRRDWRGAVFGDDGWKTKDHWRVKVQYMPPEVPGHENPMHPDALCGAQICRHGGGTDWCRLKARHAGRCQPYAVEIERTHVKAGAS